MVEETTWANEVIMTINFSNPSVPSRCTLESYSTSHEAGIDYVMTIQSRDTSGNELTHDDDTYSITLTRSDGGGSEVLTATATHQSNGLYEATLIPTPTVAGTYTMTVDLTNDYTARTGVATAISGTPLTVTVVPGEIDPAQSHTDLSGSPLTTANVAFDFAISFVDLWGNVHDTTLNDEIADGMVVTVTADYVNHVNWVSPIRVADLANWSTTYGTSVSGSASDNNDGTMTGTVTLFKAATYRLSVKIDGVDILDSPYSSLEVEPGPLDATSSVADNVPELMYAGFDYDFDI